MINPQATLLLAHGSRDPHWLEPFKQLLQTLKALTPDTTLELAFMELAEPSLETQIEVLARAGIKRINIIPLFFAAGQHLRRDVPAQITALQQHLAEQEITVEIQLHGPVGLEPEVIQGMLQTVVRLTQ